MSGEVVSEYREDPEAIAAHLRARVAELERERDAAVEAHAQLLSRIAADGTLDAMERAKAAEQRFLALDKQRHDEMAATVARYEERLAAAEPKEVAKMRSALAVVESRVKRLEVELAGVCGAAESLLSPDSSAVDVERLRTRVNEARVDLAASDCRCGHTDAEHYADAEARGRPCRECGCLGMDSDEVTAREGKP